MSSSPSLAVLEALDTARTQWYHVTAIVIAGMGFFTDAYDLFCISTVSKLLGRLYYAGQGGEPGKLPTAVNNLVIGVALIGTLTGQLVFGWLGDKLGRKKVYGITLILMAICAIGSGLSFGKTKGAVLGSLCFFRFWLGFGIGGDYPLSATIMSEYANKKTRGQFIAAVFAMQGVGIIFAGLVSMTLSAIFLHYNPAPTFTENPDLSTQHAGDFLWRIVLMLGALPAVVTFYWRMKMPETARYTALIAGNAKQAANDMEKVLEIDIQAEPDRLSQFKSANEYTLLSREFVGRHGRHLVGTMTTWFLLDIAFYSQNLTQKDIYQAIHLTNKAKNVNALREMFEISRAMFVVALLGTFPGYWFTVIFIEKLGRYLIQLIGFFMMSLFMLILGIKYDYLKENNHMLFAVLFGLTFFFANFGPNSTTFVLPAELFPTRVRSTCHALSAASGKAGAMIGAFVVQSYTLSQEPSKIKKALIVLAFTNMLGFFFTFLVSETKGKSLEEISGENERGFEEFQEWRMAVADEPKLGSCAVPTAMLSSRISAISLPAVAVLVVLLSEVKSPFPCVLYGNKLAKGDNLAIDSTPERSYNRVNLTPLASEPHDGIGRYRRSSKARFSDSTSSEDEMVKGSKEERGTKPERDRVPAFYQMTRDGMKATPSPNYLEEGPSALHTDDRSKKQDQSWIDGVDHLSQNRFQLLKQLDELRDRISRSCEVTEEPRERMPLKLRGPHAPGRTYVPSAQYPERLRIRRQLDVDPLVYNHHDEFDHEPACSCRHCYHKYSLLPDRVVPQSLSSQSWRGSYLVQNRGSFPVRTQEYNQRVRSREPLIQKRATISKKKDKHLCQPFAGAAPFVLCSNCFELLRLPQIILLVSKKICTLCCGSCSEVMSLELIGKRLVASATPPSTAQAETKHSSPVEVKQLKQSKAHIIGESDTSDHEADVGPWEPTESTDDNPPISSQGLMERDCVSHLSEAEKTKGPSMSSNRSDNVESPDSATYQRATPSTTELPFLAEVISDAARSPAQDHLVHPSSSQVMDDSSNGGMNGYFDQETAVSYSDKFRQNSAKNEVITEIDVSVHECPSSSFSGDYQEKGKDENQAGIGKSDDSLVFSQLVQDERSEVSVNGHPIVDHLVRKAEKQAGRIYPGEYWYDRCAGFWGVMGQPCLGIIPPFIQEFNYPISKNCAGGNTGVLVNGRELHHKDLALLVRRGLPTTAGRSYVLEFSGNVFDEASGEELGNLGKLAPTVEKMRRGFGMKVLR
ncbi:unnamed protein product [Musa textilis]